MVASWNTRRGEKMHKYYFPLLRDEDQARAKKDRGQNCGPDVFEVVWINI